MGNESTDTKPRRKLSVWLRSAFGIALIAVLFTVLHPREIVHALTHARMDLVAIGTLLMFLGVDARAFRWLLMLAHLGIHIGYFRALEITMISLWFTTFLPGSLGGDIFRVYDMARASSKTLRPAVTIVTERITGVLALLIVAVVALGLYYHSIPAPAWIMILVITLTGLTALGLLALLLYFREIKEIALRLVPALRRLVTDERAEALASVSTELRGKPRLFVEAMLLGLLVQGLTLMSYFTLGRAIQPDIPALYFFTFVPLIEIASLLPVTINGMGLKEGLLVYSLKLSKTPEALSMSMGLLFRIASTALALVGGLLLLCRRSTKWKTG